MTGIHLATVSTALWLVGTVALFILLASWSTGTSWGLSAALVRGVRGWADRTGLPVGAPSPSSEALRPILDPYAFVRRSARDARPPEAAFGAAEAPEPFGALGAVEASGAEVIDLGERRLSR